MELAEERPAKRVRYNCINYLIIFIDTEPLDFIICIYLFYRSSSPVKNTYIIANKFRGSLHARIQ